MHILLLGLYPLPGEAIAGGVTAATHALADGLVRHGHRVSVAVGDYGIGEDQRIVKTMVATAWATADPITLYRVSVPRIPRIFRHRVMARRLQEIIDTCCPDIVHAHGTGYYAAAALAAAAQPSAPAAVITVHGVVRMEAQLSGSRGPKEWLAWQYDAWAEGDVLRRAARLGVQCIAISPYVREAFAAYDRIKWAGIPNPVADECFAVTRSPEAGRLLCPARIIPRKGIADLITAFARVAPAHPHAVLRLAGEMESMPSYAAHCRQLAAATGVGDRIHFLGNLSRSALLAELGQAQAVVLAARQETAPVAVAEALAAGCPVLATAVGGLPGMITHERTGLLVPMTGRRGDGETGKPGDGETGKQGNRETRKQGNREIRKQGNKETGRQGSRETGRLGDWEIGRPGDWGVRDVIGHPTEGGQGQNDDARDDCTLCGLAEALGRVLGHPVEVEGWSAAARSSAEVFRLDHVVTQTEALYVRLLRQGKADAGPMGIGV